MRYAVRATSPDSVCFMTGKPGWTEGWATDLHEARLYHRRGDAALAVKRIARRRHNQADTPVLDVAEVSVFLATKL